MMGNKLETKKIVIEFAFKEKIRRTMLKTFEELCDEDSICKYCSKTDYGEHKSCITPSGYWSCEGAWCKEAYEEYLDENETTENIVKYANMVKLTNKEKVDEHTT